MSQAEYKKRLKALMRLPENQVCSDCPERQPRWASLIKPPPGAPPGTTQMGLFCCLECSGSHRRLGVHIGFVRSINLDSWKEEEVLAMENGGNAKINAIFEARLNVQKPSNTASGPVRERFIRDKYERRKFFDPSAFDGIAQRESRREQQEIVSGVQRRLTGNRTPSDAARRRVEERARNKGSSRIVKAVKTPPRKSEAPPAPPPTAPEPVGDLLDFGNFDSPEAVQAAAPQGSMPASNFPAPSESASNAEQQLDFFGNMDRTGSVPPNPQQQAAPAAQPQTQLQQPEEKRMSNADIMSMFNTPQTNANSMQQNMFAAGGSMPVQMGGMNQMTGMVGQQQWAPNMMQPQMGGSMGMMPMGSMAPSLNRQQLDMNGMHQMNGHGINGMQVGMQVNSNLSANQHGMGGQFQPAMHQMQMQMNGMQIGRMQPNMGVQNSTQTEKKKGGGQQIDQFAQFGSFR
mmetsp:Transcript_16572/g.38474  ORF Transcript_16572/g.38474 Transcript_16572/m.38474 type:complete len:459 (-) Transcript_16572:143-1519(-)